MIASVHIADVGFPRAARRLLRAPSSPGLRRADVAFTAPLGGSIRPSPQVGRLVLIAFWDDDASLDRFLADHPTASAVRDGWHTRLDPLRAFGSWPGVPGDIPRARNVGDEGPAVVLTLGRLRLTQAPRFFRTTNKAENRAINAPGFIWATGMARPPFVGTCSLWESTAALSDYAYGSTDAAHPDAIAADRAKPFHRREAFIRFRPYASQGSLQGRNPLAENWMDPAAQRG